VLRVPYKLALEISAQYFKVGHTGLEVLLYGVHTVWDDGPYHFFEHLGCASGPTPHLGSLDSRDAAFNFSIISYN
jgi:hypothetical protein